MNAVNAGSRCLNALKKRFISSGCEHSKQFITERPYMRFVVKATCHEKNSIDFVTLKNRLALLYGQVSAFQCLSKDPKTSYVGFVNKHSRFHAVNFKVDNYSFENVHHDTNFQKYPTPRPPLFPFVAVATVDKNLHDTSKVLGYLKEKAKSSDPFCFVIEKETKISNVNPNLWNVYLVFWDEEIYHRVVPDDLLCEIPASEVSFAEETISANSKNQCRNVLFSRQLPLYLNNNLASKISSVVFEWDKFKSINHRSAFALFESFGTAESYESAGHNRILVNYSKIHQDSPLYLTFSEVSLFGKANVVLNPKPNLIFPLHVYLPRDQNSIFSEELAPILQRNSFTLHNFHTDIFSDRSNLELVGGILNRCRFTRLVISAEYDEESKTMSVLLQHPAYVDVAVKRVNEFFAKEKSMNFEGVVARAGLATDFEGKRKENFLAD